MMMMMMQSLRVGRTADPESVATPATSETARTQVQPGPAREATGGALAGDGGGGLRPHCGANPGQTSESFRLVPCDWPSESESESDRAEPLLVKKVRFPIRVSSRLQVLVCVQIPGRPVVSGPQCTDCISG